MHQFFRHFAGLIFRLAVVSIFTSLTFAQGLSEGVRQMELQQKGKVVRMRDLVADSKLHYDKSGALLGKMKPGRWTWNGTVQVKSIDLKDGVIRIKANRLLLNYQRSIHKFNPLTIGEGVEIDIETAADSTAPNVIKEWNKAFLTPRKTIPKTFNHTGSRSSIACRSQQATSVNITKRNRGSPISTM